MPYPVKKGIRLSGVPTGRPPSYPRNLKPYRPYVPASKPVGLPLDPYNHPVKKPFGRRLPLAPVPKAAIGGLARRGVAFLLRRNPYIFIAAELFNLFPFGSPSPMYYPFEDFGWTLSCDNLAGPKVKVRTSTLPITNPCGTNLQVPTSGVVTYGDPIFIPINSRGFAFGRSEASGTRMALDEIWSRATGQPQQEIIQGQIDPIPWAPMQPWHIPWPALDPFPMPINVPLPVPRPIPWRLVPYRRPNPDRSPHEQPVPPASPRPAPRPATRPRPAPSKTPSWEIQIQPSPKPGGLPRVQQGPSNHVKRPPKARETEKKVIMGINQVSRLGRLLGGLTESIDFLNVVYNSLDWSIRRKYYKPLPHEKIMIIMGNLDMLGPGELLTNFLSEQFEDKAFGKMGKIGAKAAREAHRTGHSVPRPELGPGDQPVGVGNARGGAGNLDQNAFVDWVYAQMGM